MPNREPIRPVVDKLVISKALVDLQKYKDGKRNLESRIKEEERWWGLRHWDIIRGKQADLGDRPEPTSAMSGKSSFICFSTVMKRASPTSGASGATYAP